MYRKQERVNTNTPASNILQAGVKNRDSEGNCLSRLGGRQPGAHSGRVTGEDVVHNGCWQLKRLGMSNSSLSGTQTDNRSRDWKKLRRGVELFCQQQVDGINISMPKLNSFGHQNLICQESVEEISSKSSIKECSFKEVTSQGCWYCWWCGLLNHKILWMTSYITNLFEVWSWSILVVEEFDLPIIPTMRVFVWYGWLTGWP